MALQAVGIALAPSIVDPNMAILHPSQLLQTFLEGCRPSPDLGIALVQRHQHADPPQSFRLLRARRERPRRRRAAEQRDERAALHSITSSARERSGGGTVRPSILAVSALMTSSNLLACTTGRSAALVPLRMRPV